MPPPMTTTRAWVGNEVMAPSSRPEPSAARRSGATVLTRGSPVLGRAQGWRCAPPPSAASTLTPSAHRSGSLSGRRRKAPTTRSGDGMSGRIPFLAPHQHGVEDADELAHASHQDDLGLLSLGDQPLIVRLEHGIVLGRRAHDRHVQPNAALWPSTLDVKLTAALG